MGDDVESMRLGPQVNDQWFSDGLGWDLVRVVLLATDELYVRILEVGVADSQGTEDGLGAIRR